MEKELAMAEYQIREGNCLLPDRADVQDAFSGRSRGEISGSLQGGSGSSRVPFVLALVSLLAIGVGIAGCVGYSNNRPLPLLTSGSHNLIEGALLLLVGWQALLVAARIQAQGPKAGSLPSRLLGRALASLCHDRLQAVAALVLAIGTGILLAAGIRWLSGHFQADPYADPVKWVVTGITCFSLGCQTLITLRMRGPSAEASKVDFVDGKGPKITCSEGAT